MTLTTPDPATGKLATATFPNYFTDADCKAQWKKLFEALRERMKKRGLEQAMMLGWFSDYRAHKDEIGILGRSDRRPALGLSRPLYAVFGSGKWASRPAT